MVLFTLLLLFCFSSGRCFLETVHPFSNLQNIHLLYDTFSLEYFIWLFRTYLFCFVLLFSFGEISYGCLIAYFFRLLEFISHRSNSKFKPIKIHNCVQRFIDFRNCCRRFYWSSHHKNVNRYQCFRCLDSVLACGFFLQPFKQYDDKENF